MREIKFRAWGALGSDKAPRMISNWQSADLIEYVGFDGGGSFEVMQFTGLLDKNGKEIYEGDVVLNNEFEPPYPYVVDWNLPMGWWQMYAKNIYSQRNLSENEVEVIGNIHENPEILNVR